MDLLPWIFLLANFAPLSLLGRMRQGVFKKSFNSYGQKNCYMGLRPHCSKKHNSRALSGWTGQIPIPTRAPAGLKLHARLPPLHGEGRPKAGVGQGEAREISPVSHRPTLITS